MVVNAGHRAGPAPVLLHGWPGDALAFRVERYGEGLRRAGGRYVGGGVIERDGHFAPAERPAEPSASISQGPM